MKKLCYGLSLATLSLFLSCKNDDNSAPGREDLSDALLGKWQQTVPDAFGCGIVFKSANQFSFSDLIECGSGCGGTPVGGTYTIEGDFLSATTALGGIESKITIEDGVLTVLNDLDDSSDDLQFVKVDC